MSSRTRETLDEIQSRQRDLWALFGLVFGALAGGAALSLGTLETMVERSFGAEFPPFVLPVVLCLALGGVLFWAWRKTRRTQHLIRGLLRERGQNEGLRVRLQTLHCILQASSTLRMEKDVAEGLRAILQEVAVALRADRVVLYRVSPDESHLERDAVFPSSPTAAPRATLHFEDRVAEAVAAARRDLILPIGAQLADYGIEVPPPGEGFRALAAAPLVLDDRARGVLVVRNPEALCEDSWADGDTELLEIFASCAAGVLRNLRRFQASGQRIEELEEAVQTLERRRNLDVEVRTAATMTRIACSVAHALSGPLTSLRGYADLLCTADADLDTAERARNGLRSEQVRMRNALQDLVDFTATWANRFELVDLGATALEQLEAVRPELRQKGVPVRLDLYERLPLTMVDVPRMHLVFGALARFACSALRRGGEDAQLALRTTPRSGRIRTELVLHGARRQPEELAPLLEPNVEAPVLRRPGALELAIASSVVRTHQGSVQAHDDPDGALVICVELPIRRDRPPRPQRTFAVQPGKDAQEAVEVLEELLLVGEPGAGSPAEARAPDAVAEAPALQGPVPTNEAPKNPEAAATPGPEEPGPSAAPSPEREAPVPPANPLDEMDLWGHAEAPPPPAPPPKKQSSSRTTEPLLDEGDVENALSLFDQAGES